MSPKNQLNQNELNDKGDNISSLFQRVSDILSINDIPVLHINRELTPWVKIINLSRGALTYERIE